MKPCLRPIDDARERERERAQARRGHGNRPRHPETRHAASTSTDVSDIVILLTASPSSPPCLFLLPPLSLYRNPLPFPSFLAMASSSSSSRILFLLLVLSLAVAFSAAAFQLVGGRKEVPNVESNKEVQDLGLFCVEEYNHRHRAGGEELLTFLQVVAAQRQVVSGIKYYLKIAARDGRQRTFDAVVVVQPWLKSRSLLSFAPSANY